MMMTSPYMNKQNNLADIYLTKEIMEATPQKLLLKVYDFTIQQAHQKDMLKTNKGLQVLIDSLTFEIPEAKEIAVGFLRLYQYCQDQARKRDFDIVVRILTDLRDAWRTMFRDKGLI